MQVEYRIEFQGNGLTVTQRIDPNGAGPLVRPNLVKPDAVLSASAQPSALVKPDAGVKQGAELTAKFGVAEHTSAAKALSALTEAEPRAGGGIHDSTDPGGGGPQSGAAVIVFGPIIFLPQATAGLGGGIHDSTDPGGGGFPVIKAT
jgi:hypothetical protein